MGVVAGNTQTSRYDSFVVDVGCAVDGGGEKTHKRVIMTRLWVCVAVVEKTHANES
jgi:hypothetical protein